MQGQDVLFSSASVEWGTPQYIFDALDREFNFTLDVCAQPHNAKCKRWYGVQSNGMFVDGLQSDWSGHVCWMNPPYNRSEQPCKPKCNKKRCDKRGYHINTYQPGIDDWMKRAYNEAANGTTIVCLVPNRTDVAWYHRYAMYADEIKLIEGRLEFVQEGKENAAPFPSAIVIYRGRVNDKPEPRMTSWKVEEDTNE